MTSEPIRVAHVITRLILGGAQENTLLTAIGQHMSDRYDVTLVIGADDEAEGDLYDEARRAGVKLTRVTSLVRPIHPLQDIRALWGLYRLFRREGFQVVHTHSSKAGILGRVAARLARVPIVVHTLHSLVFHEYQPGWQNRLYIMLKRGCAPLTDALISVNQRTADGALAAGVGRAEQHITIFSGMHLEPFQHARDTIDVADAKRRLGVPPDAPTMGKIARLFPLKGHEQFLNAAAAVAREEPRAWFILVGDGPSRADLERRAADLGIRERVVFVGRVPPTAVPACIQAMDVVVHTSLREGIARVLPQAGIMAKPIVTFALDGAPEVVRDGVSGYLIPPLEIDALARRVVELMADPEKRTAFGAQGRQFAEANFGVDTMVARINEVYERLITQKRVRGDAPAAALTGQSHVRHRR